MKRSVLITLIGSLIVIVLLIAAILLISILNQVYDVEKNKLIISSASTTAYYTGEALTDDEWNLLSGELQAGHKLKVNVSGAQINVGRSENYLSATVVDSNGVDVTSQYEIEYKPGFLNVKSRRLYLLAGSAIKEYDGTALVCEDVIIENPSLLAEGATIMAVTEGSIENPGTTSNVIRDVKVYDVNGVDITKNYTFRKRSGTLQVYSADAIIVRSMDAHKIYDGTPLRADGYEIMSYGNLNPNHHPVVNVTGKCTSVGSVKNSFNVYILDENNKDVTASYEIVKIIGDLIIMSAEEDYEQVK